MDTIGKRIKAERQRAGMTQAKLAEKVCVGKSTIQKYELNITSPSANMLYLIGAALKCNPGNFFPWTSCLSADLQTVENTPLDFLEAYQRLNDAGQAEAIKRIKELAQLPQYSKPF